MARRSRQDPFIRPGIPAQLYRPLAEADEDRIYEATFDLLARSGMAIYSAEARDALAAAGAEVVAGGDKPIVRMPRSLVEDCIDSNPSSITLHGRDGAPDCVLEGSRVHYGTGGTAIYVLDPDTGERRHSENRDVILNARLVEALENIHLFTINVFPNEITTPDEIDVNRFFHSFDHTRKHVMGGVYSPAGCRQVVEMAELIAGSPEALRARPCVSFITLIISPFKIDEKYGDMACWLARENLPVVVPTEPICGTTSPVTPAANVLMHTAETVGGIVMLQCTRKGAPGICGSVGSITNLKTMDHVGGAIERAMLNAGVAQMAQRFEIPLYSTGGTSDAKAMDVQAAYESAMSSLLVAMSGANYIHDIAGLLETDLSIAYEKLVIDNEILGMCQRVLHGIEVDDASLALELMIEKGPESVYISESHTKRNMRGQFFRPTLANRDKRENYTSDQDALSRARRFVADLRGREVESRLAPDVRAQLLERFPAIDREARSA